MLYSNDRLLPANLKFDEGFRAALQANGSAGVELYTEFLDAIRFPGEERRNMMAKYLRERYADSPPHVLVAVSEEALDFFLKRRGSLFANAPLIYGGVSEEAAAAAKSDANAAGSAMKLETGPLIEALPKILPGLRQLYVVSGAAEFDKRWAEKMQAAAKPLDGRMTVVHWSGRPFKEVMKEAGTLPPDSAILYLSFFLDTDGSTFTPAVAAEQLAAASNAPVFGFYETYLGRGVVGAYASQFVAEGEEAGRLTRRALSGEALSSMEAAARMPQEFLFDERQLRRWGIREKNLPAGSKILFHQPGMWENHRTALLAWTAALLVQAALIIFLLYQRRERRRADKALTKSEERYREVVDSQKELVCRFQPDTILTFVNEAYCNFFGKTREQLIGSSFMELIPKEAHEVVLGNVRDLVERKRPITAEHAVTLRDGSVGWMEWTDFVILNERGGIDECQAVGRDVTARKHAEDELRRSEERFAGAFKASPSAIAISKARDGEIVDVNAAWEALFAVPRAEAVGNTPESLGLYMDGETRDRLAGLLKENGSLRQHEQLMCTRGKEARWVSVSCERIELGGEPCLISMMHDITDRKRADEAIQEMTHASRLAMVGELTASIAHEINQPLGAILNNAEAGEMLLDRGAASIHELKSIFADIRRDDVRAGNVIRGVRSLVRKRQMQMLPVDLNRLASGVAQMVRPDAQRRGVSLQLALADALPEVKGDEVHLQQVLLNLILNGMDAMKSEPRTRRNLVVKTSARNPAETPGVEVSVSDCGPGVPAEKMQRIFDSFFSTKPEGMGLGLAIARSIIESHGGKIHAQNNEGGGATFRFFVPC